MIKYNKINMNKFAIFDHKKQYNILMAKVVLEGSHFLGGGFFCLLENFYNILQLIVKFLMKSPKQFFKWTVCLNKRGLVLHEIYHFASNISHQIFTKNGKFYKIFSQKRIEIFCDIQKKLWKRILRKWKKRKTKWTFSW